ncbi:MAG: hypothetical protein KC502_18440 [Myxococcales bacterium]|nr:hypothetical protein [Myxococcales bacterium]
MTNGTAAATRAPRNRWNLLTSLIVPLTVACSGGGAFPDPGIAADVTGQDSAGLLDDGQTKDSSTHDDTAQSDALSVDTSAALKDTAVTADGAEPDASASCACPAKQVWLHGACVPNPLLGCGEPCQAGGCAKNYVCDNKAASTSCVSSDLKPACVPGQAMGFADGDLRVHPTEVKVGQEVMLFVRGRNFYIGALWWLVNVSVESLKKVDEYSTPCTLQGKWTASKPGVFAVRVGYGDVLKPGKGGLAGFIRVGGGKAGIQPGMPCNSADKCEQGDGWKCACTGAGRCGCSVP